MKKYLLLLSAVIITLMISCDNTAKLNRAKQAKTDDSLIRVYLKANPQIKVQKHPSGIYYQVLSEGKGRNPNENSLVTVNYTAALLNDMVVDKASGFSSSLDRLIKGWQIGIPLVKEGGTILLIVPSGLAYGANGVGRIPENSVMVFTVDLTEFN
ncbi:FKBP-type peptidyl-prolyl cis-trans isomerase [Mucilaginibacter sp. cycad4]|uniref:FKBP-type peptidyl-prolyl cis-trans isomerase n=1 Tax=Mucilaginibacter sp. cycad4 TaxID=3342096 RepID=UPI002AABC94E|nr:FKBP-type peptidyl-prolyl cis-trans isomerase [Mucilaginibacter gossypii]WPU99421.1 FKBP-type peptidyl-prolyl cis-trans isomerase [Mucilaginibacter gossypii]